MRKSPIALIAAIVAAVMTTGLSACAIPGRAPVQAEPMTSGAVRAASFHDATLTAYRPERFSRAAGHRAARPHPISTKGFRGSGTVWVTDAGDSAVFSCTAKRCTSIGSGWNQPQGIATDGTSIWIADTYNSRIVVLTQSGTTVATLSDPGEYPAGVAVAPNGTVAVTNICSVPSCGQGNVAFYASGATSPTGTACCLASRYYFGAFDASGNFYLDGQTSSGATIVEEIAGASSGATAEVNTGITNVGFPGGIQVATTGALFVDDQMCPCMDIFALPSFRETASFALSGAVAPVSFGLRTHDKWLWAADQGLGEAREYRAHGRGTGGVGYALGGFNEPIGALVLPDGQV
jgi:DNA-binding beta-propeller fold protein YncE